MPIYWFQFGSFPELSLAELRSVQPTADAVRSGAVHFGVVSQAEPPLTLFAQLGGSYKLFEEVSIDTTDLETAIAHTLQLCSQEKITFGITNFANIPIPSAMTIKSKLQAAGIRTRFVPSSGTGVSTALTAHSDIVEIAIATHSNSLKVLKLLSSQNPDEWSRRDREKPFVDRKRGMLTPKLARIMVNLGLGQRQPADTVVFDPFCGTGTILMEAALRGAATVGGDLDERAIAGTRQNMAWLQQQHALPLDWSTTTGSAAKTWPKSAQGKKVVVVTEPFLGSQSPDQSKLPGTFTALTKLYESSLRHWHTQPDLERIVVVFPKVIAHKTYHLHGVAEWLTRNGWSTVGSSPILYQRPDARVIRELWIFQRVA